MGNIKLQKAIKRLEKALYDIESIVGEDNMNFVGSLSIFDTDANMTDDSMWWKIGDQSVCIVNAETLLDEVVSKVIEEEREEKLFDINLN